MTVTQPKPVHRRDIHASQEEAGREAQEELRQRGAEKDPAEWTTGDEPMTGAQTSYLQTLAREAGEQVPADLTKAEASRRIEELRERTGRGEQGSG